jgi:4-hydroxyphenylpyruvate dioxygenase
MRCQIAALNAFGVVLLVSSLSSAQAFQPPTPIQQLTQIRQFRSHPTALKSTQQSTEQWKPSIQNLSDRKAYFASQDHPPDHLATRSFHHIEFYAGDASTFAKRMELALGLPITCWSSLGTGNDVCTSYGLKCGDVRFVVTAPLSRRGGSSSSSAGGSSTSGSNVQMTAPCPLPGYDAEFARDFYSRHGLAVRAVGIVVENVTQAYLGAVENGAVSVLKPTVVKSYCGGQDCELAEIQLYGDVVLRMLNFGEDGESSDAFLPHMAPFPSKGNKSTYGLCRLDHTVGNVPNLLEAQNYIKSFSNFHRFAEFTPEDIGTVDSGLNSVVLASQNEEVLLPLNEPTEGKRKSQIQTFLEQNEGPGLQHIAIKTNDIFETITKMRYAEENLGGFELMVRPSHEYYKELPDRLGDKLTPEQYAKLEELGILADADEEGVLLQIFTKPLGDRPTLFIEIIQRIGCALEEESEEKKEALLVKPGCGGFGQGNFRELFKAIEDHEKTLKV